MCPTRRLFCTRPCVHSLIQKQANNHKNENTQNRIISTMWLLRKKNPPIKRKQPPPCKPGYSYIPDGKAERKVVSGISSLGILRNGKSHVFSDFFFFGAHWYVFCCSCFTRWCVSFLLQRAMTHRHTVQAVPRTLRRAQCDILKVKVSDGKVDVRGLLLHPHPVADKPDTYTCTVSTE